MEPENPSPNTTNSLGELRVPAARNMKSKSLIMVVDDEPEIGKMLAKFLGKHNYEAIFFTSGKEALAYLKNNFACRERNEPVKILLTDMHMPGITGVELARQVKTLYPTLPIIIMSGLADGSARDEIFSLGADFIPKPLELAGLLERIRPAFKSIQDCGTDQSYRLPSL